MPIPSHMDVPVSCYSLFVLVEGWKERLAFMKASHERMVAIDPDAAAVMAVDIAIDLLQACIDETTALMAASIPARGTDLN
jgi:hypothetical protein